MCAIFNTASLLTGVSALSDKKKFPPTLLCALVSLRYPGSLCTTNTILLNFKSVLLLPALRSKQVFVLFAPLCPLLAVLVVMQLHSSVWELYCWLLFHRKKSAHLLYWPLVHTALLPHMLVQCMGRASLVLFGHPMLKLFKCFLYIPGYCEVHLLFVIVPV